MSNIIIEMFNFKLPIIVTLIQKYSNTLNLLLQYKIEQILSQHLRRLVLAKVVLPTMHCVQTNATWDTEIS